MPSPPLDSPRAFITQLFDALRAAALVEGDAVAAFSSNSNPLSSAPESVKKQLLALHVAFPHELLPALDLLDRTLVTRFRIRRNKEGTMEDAAPQGIRGSLRGGDPAGNNGLPSESFSPYAGQNLASAAGVGIIPPSGAETQHVSTREVDDEVATILQASGTQAMDVVYYVRSAQQRSSRFSTSYDTSTSYEVRLRAWNCSCPAFAFSAFPSVHPEQPMPACSASDDQNGEEYGGWSFGGLSMGAGLSPVCKHLLACLLAERCGVLFGSFVEEKEVSVEEAAGWAAGWGE